MTAIVIVLAVALAISFFIHFANARDSRPRKSMASENRPAETRNESREVSDGGRVAKLESDLDKKRRELDEVKTAQSELKAELKDVKKKLYEAKEGGKAESDLIKARAEVERQASVQLETTRAELANALAEVQKLKSDAEGGKRRREAAPAAAAAAPAQAAPVAAKPVEQVVVQKVIRELNDADKAKMAELEQKAAKARYHEIELERELKTAKGRAESQARQLRESRKESQLSKDKFRAVEARLNRTLLERDMTVRALRALEKATGQSASERIELSADEAAESDRKVAAQQAQQEKVEAEARAKLEVEAAARETAGEVPAPTPSAPAPTA
ncbi:MAG: cell envelope biogenesis protein TolA [Archangiaceae bacterium]|nr:cell envelope biogenesis protein TolA [Archangiaceae bacterium]